MAGQEISTSMTATDLSEVMGALRVPESKHFKEALGNFLDFTSTATGRATHYNTREEQEAAELAVHDRLFKQDRALYAALLTLPGTLDRARQHGIVRLLGDRTQAHGIVPVDRASDLEEAAIARLLADLPAQRVLKAFLGARDAGINNQRTRRIILRTVLDPRNLEIRAIRYRAKMKAVLRHVWGVRNAGVLCAICERPSGSWSEREMNFVRKHAVRYSRDTDLEVLQAVVAYVLGSKSEFLRTSEATPRIRGFFAARTDLAAGKGLPVEVLEGIRQTYHKDADASVVLELAKDSMTRGQRMSLQRKAREANVEVSFDPMSYDMVRLYLFAFEMGMTAEIADALDRKAAKAAEALGMRYRKVAVVLDASASMKGHESQPLRPMAIGLALRDVLLRTGVEAAVTHYAGGDVDDRLVKPAGDTALAETLVDAMLGEPDAVYLISDGYENAPAGRLKETIDRIRGLGIQTPIMHFSPVAAAEARGLRDVTGEAAVPVSAPEAMAVSTVRAIVETDTAEAVRVMMRAALERIASNNQAPLAPRLLLRAAS